MPETSATIAKKTSGAALADDEMAEPPEVQWGQSEEYDPIGTTDRAGAADPIPRVDHEVDPAHALVLPTSARDDLDRDSDTVDEAEDGAVRSSGEPAGDATDDGTTGLGGSPDLEAASLPAGEGGPAAAVAATIPSPAAAVSRGEGTVDSSTGIDPSTSPESPGLPARPRAERRRPQVGRLRPLQTDKAGTTAAEPSRVLPPAEAVEVDRPAAKAKKVARGRAAAAEEAIDLDEIFEAIRADKEDIDRDEGTVIESRIRYGSNLSRLKAASKRNWGKMLERIGENARVATRHMRVAKKWGGENGRPESEFFSYLPADMNNLEALSKLDDSQLRDLIRRVPDLKKASRATINALVKEARGPQASPRRGRKADPVKKLGNQFDSFASSVKKLKAEFSAGASEGQYVASLKAGMEKLQHALELS